MHKMLQMLLAKLKNICYKMKNRSKCSSDLCSKRNRKLNVVLFYICLEATDMLVTTVFVFTRISHGGVVSAARDR